MSNRGVCSAAQRNPAAAAPVSASFGREEAGRDLPDKFPEDRIVGSRCSGDPPLDPGHHLFAATERPEQRKTILPGLRWQRRRRNLAQSCPVEGSRRLEQHHHAIGVSRIWTRRGSEVGPRSPVAALHRIRDLPPESGLIAAERVARDVDAQITSCPSI